ncbi:MAG: MFS transporter [Trueperaceae bacterium]|nr:MFS transporter [Trueperaceae bacterium]
MTDTNGPGGGAGAFAWLSVGAALLFTSYFMTTTLAPLLAVALGAPPALLGSVVAATFVLPLLLAIPTGGWVDRVGGRPLAVAGTGLLVLAPVGVAVAPSIATLFGLQVLTGVGQLLGVVAAQSLVAGFGAGRARERNYGVYGAFVSGGQLLGPVGAGVLVDLAGFAAAFGVASGVAALGTLAFAAVRPAARPAGPPPDPAGRTPWRARLRSAWGALPRGAARVAGLLRLPSVRASLWVSGTVMVVMIAHNSFLPASLEERRVPATLIGGIVSLRSLVAVVVRPFMARIVAAFGGRRPTFLAMLALASVGTAGLAVGANLVLQGVAAVALGVAVGVAQPLTMAAMVEEVAAERHGFALGTRITANRLAQVVAPLALGAAAQAFGYAATFLLTAGFLAAMTGGLGRLRR